MRGSGKGSFAVVCLWDVDGTLLSTEGAGQRAMLRALQKVSGRKVSWEGIEVSGRTDRYILSQFAGKYGFSYDQFFEERFLSLYAPMLEEELAQSRGRVQNGVQEILTTLWPWERCGVLHGLLTGNFRLGAHVKLRHFGLFPFFSFGAFAEDGFYREDLAKVAQNRASLKLRGKGAEAFSVLVIGDTPHDITCAQAIGAQALAVGTGRFSKEELQEVGGALVWENLEKVDQFLQLIEDLRPVR
jgi:phosphoglycolate phosphatase